MSIEIERKFLVKHVPNDLWMFGVDEIEQNYLATGDEEVRIRKKVSDSGESSYFITIKSGNGKIRNETEFPILEHTYQSLSNGFRGIPLKKTRQYIEYKDLTFEVDNYNSPRGMIIVEVEFPTEEASEMFVPPEWFGREVTDNKGYKNQNLWKLIQEDVEE